MRSAKEETPEQKLEWELKELRELATRHKRADVSLSKNAINMTLKDVQLAKDKIAILAKQMNPLIKKVEGKGFKWESEKERRKIQL